MIAKRLLLLLIVLTGFSQNIRPLGAVETSSTNTVIVIEVSDYISSATAEMVESGIRSAEDRNARAVLITLNTFGGLLESTFKITETITRSRIPILGFVYPAGGQALSAGTYILLFTDYAAMAPVTTIGSAQPVSGTGPVNDSKTVNALVEKMIAAAELHDRNVTQAKRFVTHNDNLTPAKAEKFRVIEAIAANPEELIAKADGATVRKAYGEVKLNLRGIVFSKYEPSIRVTLLGVLSNPYVTSLLTAVGFIVLILGLLSPGAGAEVAGMIMIILGLVGQGFNPNLVAFALMAVGAGLLVFELHNPGFGAFGVGGLLALALGAAFMITQPPSPLLVSPEYIQGFLLSTAVGITLAAGFFGFIIYKAVSARRLKRFFEPEPTGEGRTIDDIAQDKVGYVVIGGEYWKAKGTANISAGSRIVSIGSEGGILVVRPLGEVSSLTETAPSTKKKD